MLNSKWQIHRIGLIDFWYYDDEEFYFLDGRLLLRGANGSGKSVTMQSFIPLLLDGNKSPARLDPFGTNARQIGNYLLEDGDGRDERTGYLYMEFKRADSDTFMTIGMGLKATRRTNKVDSWYFHISDGRRIGKDFYLYKEADTKICLSKIELRNRISGGGTVLDGQREYMELVNKQLFAFETMDEYKELINLLIQLRTPKLSKDFKPTVINEILSNSLQSLSEDDLRPMSEAVENMDILEANLENLKESKKAADKIKSVYDQYNKVLLYERASQYIKSGEKLRDLLDGAGKNEELLLNLQNWLLESQLLKEKLEEEQGVLTEQKKNLEKNDVVAMKEEQLRLMGEIGKLRTELQDQEKRYEEKKQKRVDTVSNHQQKLQETQRQKSFIAKQLETMEVSIEDITFDEHFFMKDELKENLDKPYDFQMLRQLWDKLEGDIEKGLDELKEEERIGRHHDEALSDLEKQKKERHRLEREGTNLENQLLEIKGELIEKLHKWNRGNEELLLSQEQVQEVSRWIDNYNKESDFSELRDQIRQEKNSKEEKYNKQRLLLENEKELLRIKIDQKKEELFTWESNEEPEPLREPSVLRNRQILDEKHIPYKPLYKLIDFNENMTEEQSDRIEESLMQMGMLDALVIPQNYKKQVLNVDKGCCDKYIFCDPEEIMENMSSLLSIDQDEYDLVLYQQITNLLNAVGTMEGAGTYIDLQGSYGMGVLKGTITREYKAKYIGVKARHIFRLETIHQLRLELEALTESMSSLNAQLETISGRLALLNEEQRTFPDGDDLKTALKDLLDSDEKLWKQVQAVQASEIKTSELQGQRNEIKNRIFLISKRVNLIADIPVFTDARRAVKEYKNLLGDLIILHSNYGRMIEFLNNLSEQIEGIDEDLDGILYDKTKIERRLSEDNQRLDKCNEQLSISNYDEIKEQLDYCLIRLEKIPKEKENAIESIANTKNKIEHLEKGIEIGKKEIEREEHLHRYLMSGFQAEYQLNYLNLQIDEIDKEEETEKLGLIVCSELERLPLNKSKEDLHGTLQEKYHENKPNLVEYNLALTYIFDGSHEQTSEHEGLPGFKRLDIVGKFRGKQVKFNELLKKLEEDIEEQDNLLKESDRELFEEILANTISKKIRNRIYNSESWVKKMNRLMESMNTSSGLTLSLAWKSKRAEQEEQLDTRELVDLLRRDAEIMKDEEFRKLSEHFRSKIQEARKVLMDSDRSKTFHFIIKEVLDYRKWFEFQLYYKKTGEDRKELTDRTFNAFSGGEKAITMYVPLFSAVVAKYAGAREDAPKLISLDEAFAGVDENNINDLFRMMVELDFNFIVNSQVLWGDYETVPKLAIYQLLRPENAKFVTVIPYAWNGFNRKAIITQGELDEG